ncbi:MAG: hypothetical protein J5I93_07605 [Pirellulaceae bacterium]|nr:hypothetical protein [Pirellulaceae bacterium]
MKRFVLLRHELPDDAGRPSHWDLMFERDESDRLWTWSLAELPRADGPVAALRLPDHRRDYLDYEGPVSGNRGTVRRWDAGTYRILRNDEGDWLLQLNGQRLQGQLRLARLITPDESPASQRWNCWLTAAWGDDKD